MEASLHKVLEDDDEGKACREDVPEHLGPLVLIRVARRVAEAVVPVVSSEWTSHESDWNHESRLGRF